MVAHAPADTSKSIEYMHFSCTNLNGTVSGVLHNDYLFVVVDANAWGVVEYESRKVNKLGSCGNDSQTSNSKYDLIAKTCPRP